MTDYMMEWNVICRVCLQDGEMISVYDKDDNDISFCEKIMYCASVNITTNENLPEFICMQCVDDLNTAYRFRSVCESSNAILQSYQVDEKPIIQADETAFVSEENGLYQFKIIPQDIKIKKVSVNNERNSTRKAANKKKLPTKQYTKLIPEVEETVIKVEPTSGDDLDQMVEIMHEEEYLDDEDSYLDMENVTILAPQISMEPNLENEIELATAELGASLQHGGLYIKSSDFPADSILDLGNIRIKKEVTDTGEEYYELSEEMIAADPDAKQEIETDEYTAFEVIAPKKRGRKRIKIDGEKKDRPHMCEICGNTYRFRFNLEAHTRRHTGEKPFCCNVCGKGFVIAFELRRHMRCHTGVKPYQCKYCERKFSDFGSRIKHQRSHTGERPYVCEVCGKTFAYSHVLSSHNLIHTGVKKYGCDACGKRFTKSHHLKAHLNVHLRISPSSKLKTKSEPIEILIPQD